RCSPSRSPTRTGWPGSSPAPARALGCSSRRSFATRCAHGCVPRRRPADDPATLVQRAMSTERRASTEQRLNRLLALVPYLLAHPGITAAEAAADFQITEQQLRKDLDLLWMC